MSTAPVSAASATEDADFWVTRITAHGLDALRDSSDMCRIVPAPRRFVFLRHGETDGNFKRIYQSAEISLNDNGRLQAEFASGLLKGAGIRRIAASDMQRGRETAAIVGQALGLAPVSNPGLRERWFGDLVGTSNMDLNWRNDPPNGERAGEFVRRTLRAFEQVLGPVESPDEGTLVIAHGGNLYVLAFSLGVELTLNMIQNATPLEFTRGSQGWTVKPVADGGGQPPRHRNLGW